MAIAGAEIEGHWTGDSSGAATQQALAGLAALKELGGDQSELLRLVKERAPTLLKAALRNAPRKREEPVRRRPRKEKLSTRWREAIEREEGHSAPRGSRRRSGSKPPLIPIVVVVFALLFLLRVCG